MDEFEKKKAVRRAYLLSFNKGRGAVARTIDGVFFLSVGTALVWLAVHGRVENSVLAFCVTAACVLTAAVMLRIVRKLKLEKHISALRNEARREVVGRKALMRIGELRRRFEKDGVYFCDSAESLTADDVLAAKAKGCSDMLSLAPATPAAEKLITGFGIKLKKPLELDGPDVGIGASEEEIDNEIIKSLPARSRFDFKGFIKGLKLLSHERAVRYFTTGAALFLLSFAVRYSLYYRLAASLCMSLGTAVFAAETLKAKARN